MPAVRPAGASTRRTLEVRPPLALLLCCLAMVLAPSPGTAAPPRARAGADHAVSGGHVRVSLRRWTRLLRAATSKRAPSAPTTKVTVLDRSVEGRFERGTLLATLTLRVVVLARGYVRVPLLPAAVSATRVTIDGKPATLIHGRPYYTIGVDKPGEHRVVATFIAGRSQARFARRVRLSLPPGGATRLSLSIPEKGIRARLAGGALIGLREVGAATKVVGYLDGRGRLELTWTRELDHHARAKTRIKVRQLCLYTLGESLARGVSVFDVDVLDGEADRVDLRVPRGVEILAVKGKAVLQWRTLDRGRRLAVLMRYLVRDRQRIVVRFQAPAAAGAAAAREVSLPLLRPARGVSHTGVVAVQAPAALDVKLLAPRRGRLDARDVPAALSALTRSPLLFGVALRPSRSALKVRVKRRRAVAVARTLIDHLQAATVLLGDGSEVTKLKLHVRNNTRQYLRLSLPSGARVLHVLVDGLVGATSREGDQLSIPLRQSERVADRGGRTHVVRPNQTLGDIAHFYYSDPAKWPLILRANRGVLRDEKSVQAGQKLRIPSAGPVTVEESSFVIELAYRLRGRALSSLGRRRFALPALDVDATRTTWHLYLPRALTPLRFGGSLTQLTAVRYGPFRRALRFLRRVLATPRAHAGGAAYKSILARRKGIFRAEARARQALSATPGAFPVLGRRYRFRRLLPSRDGLTIELSYLGSGLGRAARVGAFAVAAALALWLLALARRRLWHLLVAALVAAALLALAHYVSGVHRALAWAIGTGAALSLWRLWRRGRRERAQQRASERICDAARAERELRAIEGPPERWVLRALRPDDERLLFSPWLALGRVGARHLLIALGASGVLGLALRYPATAPLLLAAVALSTWRVAVSRRRRRARATQGVGALAAVVLGAIATGAIALGVITLAPSRAEAAGGFDAIVAAQNRAAARRETHDALLRRLGAAHVRVPLALFGQAYRKLLDQVAKKAHSRGPALLYAESIYRGRAKRGGLRLELSLRVVLGRPGTYKRVPLVGSHAAVLAARVDGKPIGLVTERGYHVWHTRRAGEITVRVTLLAPPRGPRGSVEYDFRVVRTPVTRLRCTFPRAGLEPRVGAAVRAEVTHPDKRSTELRAALRPTTRIKLLGLRDLPGGASARRARVFAETVNLLSLEPGKRELFSVIRYTILYAGVRAFHVAIPAGMQVVSASGRGGLHHSIVRRPDGSSVLRGETAYPITGSYEVSLRLRRRARRQRGAAASSKRPAASQSAAGDATKASAARERFDVPLPRCLNVERESGWLAVEVPGTLELREFARAHIAAVDVRQLPDTLVRSAVAPILAAYRYDDARRRLALSTRRLPEQRRTAEVVDRLRAFTVIAADGRALHEIRMTMRNRTRRSITLAPPAGYRLRSALLDGRPVQASLDEQERVVLPLARGQQGSRQTLHVVFVSSLAAPRWIGRRELRLPRVSLPVSSLAWSVFAPRRNRYAALRAVGVKGSGGVQRLYGHLRWQRPRAGTSAAVSSASARAGTTSALPGVGPGAGAGALGGAMPVRIKVPKRGVRLEVTRYWLRRGEVVGAELRYVARALLYPAAAAGALLFVLALLVALRRRVAGDCDDAEAERGAARRLLGRIGRILAITAAVGCAYLLDRLVHRAVAPGLALLVLSLVALRRGLLRNALLMALDWLRSLRRSVSRRAWRGTLARMSPWRRLARAALLAAVLAVGLTALAQGLRLFKLLAA